MKILRENDYIYFLRNLVSGKPRRLFHIGNGLFVEVRPGFDVRFMEYEEDLPDFIDSVVEKLIITTRPTIIIPYADPSFIDHIEGSCILFFIGDGYRVFLVIESSTLVLCFMKSLDGLIDNDRCLVKMFGEKPFLGIGWGDCRIV